MKFDAVNCTIFKADGGSAFEFSPAAFAERFMQTCDFTYPVADSNCFYSFDPANELEIFIHLPIVFLPHRPASPSTITISSVFDSAKGT